MHRAEETFPMRNRCIVIAAVLLLVFSLLAGQAAAETAVVTGKGVNVRSGPGMGYKVTDTLAKGTIVEIMAQAGGEWVAVRYPGGSGYMSSDYLEIAGPDLYLDSDSSQSTYHSNAESVFLDDGVSAPVVTTVPTPAPVYTPAPTQSPVTTPIPTVSPSSAASWPSVPTQAPVYTPQPTTSSTPAPTSVPTSHPLPTANPLPTPLPMPSGSPYPLATAQPEETPTPAAQQMVISSGDLSSIASPDSSQTVPSAATGMDVVEFACRFLGYRYTWSGKDPSTGFDCSGFVWYVYSQFGYDMNRVASSQASNGVHVDSGDLRMGDVLCFYTYGSYIGHSGIYIGNGKFIHAANSATGVVITELSSYAYKDFEARRIIV